MPIYAIPDIAPGTTIVEISRLRKPFANDDVDEMRMHLGETYAWFLQQGCTMTLNDEPITPGEFTAWAYPPGYSPRNASFRVPIGHQCVSVDITAGLISDRDPENENYGVYVYCNHRLIAKALRTCQRRLKIPLFAG
jgi:hypothetical protein